MTKMQNWAISTTHADDEAHAAHALDQIPPSTIGYFGVIVAILSAAFVTKVALISGPLGSDDLRYLGFTEELYGTFHLETLDHAASRLAFLVLAGLPAAATGKLYFGALAGVVYSTITEVIIVRFVYNRFGLAPAATAALFVAFAGVTLVYSGTLLPEAVLSLFFTCACICVFRAVSGTSRQNRRSAALAGLFAGLAYSAKDTGILLLPGIVACLLLLPWPPSKQLRDRTLLAALFLGSFAAVWMVESITYLIVAGDFFYRSNAISGVHNASIQSSSDVVDFIRRGWWNLHGAITTYDFLLLPLMLAGASWAAMLRDRSPWAVFSIIGTFTATFLLFGTSSFSRLLNLPFQERYLSVVFPLIGVGIAFLFATTRHGIVKSGIVAAVLIHALMSISGAVSRSGNLYFDPLLRNAAVALEVLPQISERDIFVDERYRAGLQRILAKDKFDRLKPLPSGPTLSAGYYFVFPADASSEKDAQRNAEIRKLPVALRIALPHSFLSRYFLDQVALVHAVTVYEKKEEDEN
jgi:hypothetical protein